MPDFLEGKLFRAARDKGLTGRKADQYTYGAMNNQGLMAGNQITDKGRKMERKHNRDIARRVRRGRRA